MKTEIQKAGTTQQQSIPLLQIVLMKFPGRRLRAMRRDAVEIIPGKAAHSAIIVSLAPKTEAAEWQQRKLGDRTREAGRWSPARRGRSGQSDTGKAIAPNLR